MPGPRTRTTSPPLKSRLIEQAFLLLDREGPEGVTIRAVARAAGVSHAAPANHFADRRQLLTEMAARIFGQYLDMVASRESPGSENRARAYLTALIDYGLSFPGRYQLLWRKDLVDWENPSFLDPLNRAYDDFLRALGAGARRAGRDRDIETLGTAAWAMAHGYAVLRSTGIFEPRSDAFTGQPRMEAMLDLLLGPDQQSRKPSG